MTRSKEILVVDDEAGIRNLLFDVLSGEGFNVSLAKDGQNSLDQMEMNSLLKVVTSALSQPAKSKRKKVSSG